MIHKVTTWRKAMILKTKVLKHGSFPNTNYGMQVSFLALAQKNISPDWLNQRPFNISPHILPSPQLLPHQPSTCQFICKSTYHLSCKCLSDAWAQWRSLRKMASFWHQHPNSTLSGTTKRWVGISAKLVSILPWPSLLIVMDKVLEMVSSPRGFHSTS